MRRPSTILAAVSSTVHQGVTLLFFFFSFLISKLSVLHFCPRTTFIFPSDYLETAEEGYLVVKGVITEPRF